MLIDNPSLTASKGSKCYTLFPTYIDAFIWLESIPLVNRNCYEIIPAGPQKPHFDIDIPIDKIQPGQDITIVSADVMTHITSAIERVLLSHNVNYHKDRNLLVFSSHGPAKRSFHIIIDGLYHSDNKQAKNFYLLVINELPGHLRQYVDGSVYSRNQNFRLLNNQKKDSDRIKILDPLTSYHPNVDSDMPEALRLFEASLIGFTSGSIMLPSFSTEPLRIKRPNIHIDDVISTSMIGCFESSEFYDDFEVINSNWNGVSLR